MGMVTVHPLWETPNMWHGELRKGNFMDISELSGWDEKDENVPEELTLGKTSH